jgi:predicted nucleotidyltransferase
MGKLKTRPLRPKPRRTGAAQIRRVADQIAAAVSPERIILFGSYARGKAGPDSDVDLLVVTDKPLGPDASLRIRRKIEYSFPLDLVVCDARRLERRIRQGDFFLQEAVSHGRLLYEKPDR